MVNILKDLPCFSEYLAYFTYITGIGPNVSILLQNKAWNMVYMYQICRKLHMIFTNIYQHCSQYWECFTAFTVFRSISHISQNYVSISQYFTVFHSISQYTHLTSRLAAPLGWQLHQPTGPARGRRPPAAVSGGQTKLDNPSHIPTGPGRAGPCPGHWHLDCGVLSENRSLHLRLLFSEAAPAGPPAPAGEPACLAGSPRAARSHCRWRSGRVPFGKWH